MYNNVCNKVTLIVIFINYARIHFNVCYGCNKRCNKILQKTNYFNVYFIAMWKNLNELHPRNEFYSFDISIFPFIFRIDDTCSISIEKKRKKKKETPIRCLRANHPRQLARLLI